MIDHLGEPWAVPLPSIPLENGSIRGAIDDAQSRLNLNALGASGRDAPPSSGRDCSACSRSAAGRSQRVDAIADWIDADSVPRPAAPRMPYYLAQATPAVAADAPVLRSAELLAVRGVTDGGIGGRRALRRRRCRPTRRVNVNTAPAAVLAAIVDGAGSDALAISSPTARPSRSRAWPSSGPACRQG